MLVSAVHTRCLSERPVPTAEPRAVHEAPRFSDPEPSWTGSVLLQPVLLLLMITGPKLPAPAHFLIFMLLPAPGQCWAPAHLASLHPSRGQEKL